MASEAKIEITLKEASLVEEPKTVKVEPEPVLVEEKVVNKGTGAGGPNTNFYGKKFEERTDNEPNLLLKGFEKKRLTRSKFGYYMEGQINGIQMVFVKQNGFKTYMQKIHKIECIRCPDEAYIIKCGDRFHVVVIEKKEQNVAGSVETKLWSGPALKREYEIILGDKFTVSYSFTLSQFFQEKFSSTEKKYTVLKQILDESDIPIFYGDDEQYQTQLEKYIVTRVDKKDEK
jgi:hypothetical protein